MKKKDWLELQNKEKNTKKTPGTQNASSGDSSSGAKKQTEPDWQKNMKNTSTAVRTQREEMEAYRNRLNNTEPARRQPITKPNNPNWAGETVNSYKWAKTPSSKKEPVKDYTNTAAFREVEKYAAEHFNTVSEADIQSFFKNASDLLSDYQNKASQITYGKEQTTGADYREALAEINAKRDDIRAFLNGYKNKNGTSYNEEYEALLDQYDRISKGLKNAIQSGERFYSQWDSEQAYNTEKAARQKAWDDYQKQVQLQQEQVELYRKVDVNAAQKELSDLESARDQIVSAQKAMRSLGNAPSSFYVDLNNRANELLKKTGYDTLDELQAAIDEQRAYVTSVKQFQSVDKFEKEAQSDNEFGYWVIQGQKQEEEANKQWQEAEKIDNKWYSRLIAALTPDDEQSVGAPVKYEIPDYGWLENDEQNVLRYYLAKERAGKVPEGTAAAYLSALQYEYNMRGGEKRAQEMENDRFAQILFSAEAGLDQFTTGVVGVLEGFVGKDTVSAPSQTQIAYQYVREDMGNWGPKIGGENGVFVGQALYDTLTTTFNMIPSIGLSAAVSMIAPGAGAAVGAATMGASAAGNAYREMIQAGYGVGQARAYGLLTGASEAGLQYVLGGIAKLGGTVASSITGKTLESITKGIGNAMARYAIQTGGKFVAEMASEGLEEFMQDILEPLIKSVATGDLPAGVDIEQALYSGVLGALSAGLMNGVSGTATMARNIDTVRQLAKNGGTQALINLGKSFDQSTVAGQLANEAQNGKIGTLKAAAMLSDIYSGLGAQTETDIRNALIEQGMTETEADYNAAWLAKAAEKGRFTNSQAEMMDADPRLAEAASLVLDRNSSINQRYNDLAALQGREGKAGIDFAEASKNNEAARTMRDALSLRMQGVEVENGPEMGRQISNAKLERAVADMDLPGRNSYGNFIDRTSFKEEAQAAAEQFNEAAVRKLGIEPALLGVNVNESTGRDPSRIESIDKNGNVIYAYADKQNRNTDGKHTTFKTAAAALVWRAVAKMGVDAEAANGLANAVSKYNPVPVERQLLGLKDAFDLGKKGIPLTAVDMGSMMSLNDLTDAQIKMAHKLGTEYAGRNYTPLTQEEYETRQKAVAKFEDKVRRGEAVTDQENSAYFKIKDDIRRFEEDNPDIRKQNKQLEKVERELKRMEVEEAISEKELKRDEAQSVHLEIGTRKGDVELLGIDAKTLTPRQRRSILVINALAKSITKNRIVWYESVLNENGDRVYGAQIVTSKETYEAGDLAANGIFDPGTGTIYLDINAGNKGQGGILFAASHEFTHFLHEYNRDQFDALGKFLEEKYAERGYSVDKYVSARLERIKESNSNIDPEKARDLAYEEWVARSMETMLTDTNAAEYLAELKQKDRGLWQKMKDFFMRIANRARVLYEGMTPDSDEAQLMRTFGAEDLEKFARLFSEGLVKAGENYEAAEDVVEDFTKEYQKTSAFTDTSTNESVKFSIREEDPPKKTKIGYKVFFVKDGKLYPPMVANPGGADTPVGVWLNADIGAQAPNSKTGRKQVKAGGKGTQGSGGSLAFRPGWHLGEIPLATQFDRLNPETGKKELFPENFVWAECEIAADIDYQEEAMSYGYTKNGKFQHSLAGLPRLPVDGYYQYRTNPNPETVPWLITGAMKVTRLLSDADVNKILAENGIAPKQRVGGEKTLADLGLENKNKFSDRDRPAIEAGLASARADGNQQDVDYFTALKNGDMETAQRMVDEAAANAMPNSKVRGTNGNLLRIYHGTDAKFWSFEFAKHSGKNGEAEGFGIYLTDNPEVSKHYGERQIEGYANITRPAYGFKKTINRNELSRMIEKTVRQEAVRMVEEEGYESEEEAMYDTWISNYVMTYDYQNPKAAIMAAADLILRQIENDADVVYEVLAGMGIRNAKDASVFYDEILTPTTGIEGIWQKWNEGDKEKEANIFLAFRSEQIKSADTITYDDNGNIIPLSERFNEKDSDIRFSDRVDNVVNTAIKNKGNLNTKRNHEIISHVPSDLADMVYKASAGLIDIKKKQIAINGGDLYHEYKNHSNPKTETARDQIALTPLSTADAIKAIYSPDYVEAAFMDRNNPSQRQSFIYAKKADGYYVVVEAVGGRDNPSVTPRMILNFTEHKWDRIMAEGKTLAETVFENDPDKLAALDIEKIKRNRVTVAKPQTASTYSTFSTVQNNVTTKKGISQPKKSDRDRASMTEERIDWLIRDNGAGKRTDYARGWITAISPTDFINLTTKEFTDRSKFDKMKNDYGTTMGDYDYMRELKENLRETPYLAVDMNTGKVVGHEGRHRMRALEQAGVTSVPIKIEFRDENGYVAKEMNGYGNPLETLFMQHLINQYGGKFETDVENVIPLMQAKRDEIIAAYGQEDSAIRFSDRDRDATDPRTLLSNALMTAAQSDIEKQKLEQYQRRITQMNAEQQKLSELREAIRKISFAKGKEARTAQAMNAVALTDIVPDEKQVRMTLRNVLVNSDTANGDVAAAVRRALISFVSGKSSYEYFFHAVEQLTKREADAAGYYMPQDSFLSDTARELRGRTIYMDPATYAEVAESFGGKKALRDAAFGKLNITTDSSKSKGTALDVFYDEVRQSYYGGLDETTSPTDQMRNLLDVFEQGKADAIWVPEKLTEEEKTWRAGNMASEIALDLISKTKLEQVQDPQASKKILSTLREEATKTANRVTNYDRQLLRLEASKPLERVVDELTKQKATKEVAKARQQERAKAQKRYERLEADIQHRKEMRQKGIDQRHSTDLRTKIKKIRDDFQNRLLKGNERTYIPKELADGVIAVCEAIDPTGENQESKAAQKYRTGLAALGALRNAYDALKNSPDTDLSSEFQQAFSDRIGDLAAAIGNKPLRDMNRNELEDVYNVLSDIRHMLMNAKKQIREGEAITNYAVGQNIIDNMIFVKEKKLTTNAVASFFRNWMTNPIRAVRELTGYQEGAELTRLIEDFVKGLRKGAFFSMEAHKKLEDLQTGKVNKKLFRDAVEKAYDFGLTDVDGKPLKISKMQAMQILLTFERETSNANRQHLSTTIYIPDIDLMRKGKYEEALRKGQKMPALTEETLGKLIDGLNTEWDKAFMQAARDVFKMSADAVNEVSMVLIGRPIATENNYITYEVDQDYIARESENVAYDASIENMGMTKSVMPNSRKPLVIRGLNATLDNHISDVAKYYGLAIPKRNWSKAYNMIQTDMDGGVSVKEAIGRTWGPKEMKLLEQAVADVQGPRRGDTIPILSKIRQNFVAATLSFNVSVWMKQAASYPTAGSILSGKALIKGLKYLGTDLTPAGREALWAEIDAHTATHYNRRIGLSIQELGDFNQSHGWQKKASDWLGHFSPMDWIQSMDVRTTAALWVATKAQVEQDIKGTDIQIGSEEYWNRVTELYDRVIEETQPMYDPLHRAEIMKNKAQNFIMFQTQPLQNSGILRDATMELRAAKKTYGQRSEEAKAASKQFRKAAASQLVSHAVFAAMTLAASMLLYRMNHYRDDDDELTKESALKQYGWDVLETYFGAILPVFGSYMVSSLEVLFGKSKYDVLSEPVVDMINTTINRLAALKDPTPQHIISAITDIASYLGVPLGNAWKIIDGIRLHFEDIKNGRPGKFEAGVSRTATQNKNRVYDAIVSGDRDTIDEIRDEMAANSNAKDPEKIANDNLKDVIKEAFVNGDIDDKQAKEYLDEYFGITGDKAYWVIKEWANPEEDKDEDGETDNFHKYDEWIEAVSTGQNLDAVAREYVEHGATQFSSAISDAFKEKYTSATGTEKKALADKIIAAYTAADKAKGMDPASAWDIQKEVLDKWDYAAKNGGSDKGYSIYIDFWDAVETGSNLKAVIKDYMDNGGKKKEDLSSTITTHFKPIFQKASKSEQASMLGYLLNAYEALGYDRNKKYKDIVTNKDSWVNTANKSD